MYFFNLYELIQACTSEKKFDAGLLMYFTSAKVDRLSDRDIPSDRDVPHNSRNLELTMPWI